MGLAFSDNFNRADSNTVGNSWSEGNDSGGTNSFTTEANAADNGINSNQLRQQGNNTFSPVCSRTDITPQKQITITGKLTFPTATSDNLQMALLTLMTNPTRNSGYGILFNASGSGLLSIIDNGTTKNSVVQDFVPGTQYSFEVVINSKNHVDVYVWLTAGSKPATPTLTFNNSGATYTPTASGSRFGVVSSNNSDSTRRDFLWDDLSVIENPPETGSSFVSQHVNALN